MAARSGLVFLSLLVALSLTAPRLAWAFQCTPAKKDGVARCHVSVHWAQRSIPYVIELPADTRTDRSLLLAATASAFGRWQSPRCTDLRFESRGTIPALAPTEPRPAPIVIVPVPLGWDEGAGIIALTTTTHNVDSGELLRVSVELNEEEYTFVDAEAACTGEMDLEGALTHELGHALGFAHPCEEDEASFGVCGNERCDALLARLLAKDAQAKISTMWPTVLPCMTELRTLEPDDLEAVCFVYPASAPTRPCRPLPIQPGPYVESELFGCNTIGLDGQDTWWIALAAAWLTLRRRAGKFAR